MALSKFYHASNLIFHVSIIGKKHTYSLFFFYRRLSSKNTSKPPFYKRLMGNMQNFRKTGDVGWGKGR